MRNNNMYATAFAKINPFEGMEINVDYTYNYYNYTLRIMFVNTLIMMQMEM